MKIGNDPISYLTRYMWRFSKGNRRAVVVFIILSVFANGLILLEPLLIANIINVIQQEGVHEGNLTKLISLLALFLVIAVVFWIFHGPSRVMEQHNAFLNRINLRKFLLAGVMALPTHWHTDHHSGDTIDKVEKGAGALYMFSEEFYELIDIGVRFIGAVLFLAYFDLRSGLIAIAVIVVTMIIIILYDRILIKQLDILNKEENNVAAKVYDIISNITTVIILRVQKIVMTDIVRAMNKPLKLFIKHTKLSEFKWFLVTLMSYGMIFSVLSIFLWSSVAAGSTILIGTFYALYSYLDRASEGFYRFAYVYSNRVLQKTKVKNAEVLSDQFSESEEVKQFELSKDWKRIKIRNCEFSYQDADADSENEVHIDGISLDVHHGEKIAFIGESGSGKTTMLKLIRGLYHPQKVEVTVDGTLLPSEFMSISDSIALIPQDPEIFTATIRDNITMETSQDQELIDRYADLAQFTKVVEQLPKGYDSSIVERGVNLSGGEKQRLALARGLFASDDKDIILLDEPTSSVDSKNERIIYENLFKTYPNKTMISSIHRLHLLPLFDRVYMFDNGKIIDSGTFEELQETSKYFQKIWKIYQKSNN